MIPILFNSDATTFTGGGIGRLTETISCTVTEERNGRFELELVFPITGKYYSEIQIDRIILARHSDKLDLQPFRIYRISRPIDGKVSVFGRHISYDLNKIVIMPFSAGSVAETFARIKNYTVNSCPFEFWTDKTTVATFTAAVPMSVRSALGGVQGSILDVYGGEYEFDGMTVKLYAERGTDSGVTIRYGKNLTDLLHITDNSEAFNGVAPYWTDGETVVVIPEKAVAVYPYAYNNEGGVLYDNGNGLYYSAADTEAEIVPLDLSQYFETAPTEQELRQTAVTWLANNGKLKPDTSIKVSFVALWQTEEFKNVAPLLRLGLCDTVTVTYGKLGVNTKTKVIKTVYNTLLERYDEMELGEATATLSQTLTGTITADVDSIKTGLTAARSNIASIETQIGDMPTNSTMQDAIDHATQLISGGLGGYVVIGTNGAGQPNEILVMDTPDINTAINVLRINNAGIAFSSTGYSGTYRTAWTLQDAAFVADFITAGTLNANIIKAGVLADEAGLNYWNMVTGDANFTGVVKFVDLSTSGESVINGDNIVTGKIQSANGRVYFDLINNVLSCNKIISEYVYDNEAQTVLDITLVRGTGTNKYYGASIYNSDYEAGRLRLEPGRDVSNRLTQAAHIYCDKGIFMHAAYVPLVAEDMYLQIQSQDQSSTKMDLMQMFVQDATGYQNVVQVLASSAYTGGRVNIAARRAVNIAAQDSTNGVHVDGTFSVTGTKSREVDTDGYGKRHLYCYETPSPLFGDVGEGALDETGTCYVWIDAILAETISRTQYQVFLQPYGNGAAYVAERNPNYFIVRGEPGLAFGWELKAKQADFTQLRFEASREDALPGNTTNYAAGAVTHLEELYNERISA